MPKLAFEVGATKKEILFCQLNGYRISSTAAAA
jgi:hypothetical protein